MKIVLVHGDNTLESRKRFAQIVSGVKKKDWDVVYMKELDSSFENSLANKTLFDRETLYIFEEAKGLPKPKLEWLAKADYSSQLLLYSRYKLGATVIKPLGKGTKVEEYSHPKLLFTFLESLYTGNSENAIKLLNNLYKLEPMELIVAMMGKLFRDLYWVLLSAEGLDYPAWRLGKLKSQANKFTKFELEDIISELAEIDLKAKTSDSDVKLLLELLILEKLE